MVGRRSKIDTYHLSPLIDKLRAKGKSYREIAEEINLEYSEVNLTINDISRHLRGYTKATRENLNLELMEYISTLQTELLCETQRFIRGEITETGYLLALKNIDNTDNTEVGYQ